MSTSYNQLVACLKCVVCITTLVVATEAAKIDPATLVEVARVRGVPSNVLDKIKETLGGGSSPTQKPDDLTDSEALWSVAKKDDAVKVGVHIPIVFDLTKHEANKVSKLDLSIFGGMFSLIKDKSRQPNGSMSGPTSVSLFGIPIYSATSASPSILDKINNFVTDSQIIHPLTKLSEKIDPETSRSLVNNLKEKNQRVISSLFDKLVKVTGYLSNQLQITNVNGEPVKDSSKYVLLSNITDSDLRPKSLALLGR